ncbi:rhodanese-related sulfurtransferase, partial [Candidatus Woesebacteria bacterium]|nr:rhodanese-related sulfurtransferase [Candidatus Woesebacteria bacterium]
MFSVLLYYKYTPIDDPKKLRDAQRELCQKFDIKGRIIISEEGINGTCAGTKAAIEEYKRVTGLVPGLEDMEWKESLSQTQVFPKLKVKVRPEIVTLGLKKERVDVSIQNSAQYIEPEELYQLYENGEDVVVIDARNLYEGVVGQFENAIVPDIQNFRDFPEYVKNNLSHLKDKQVVTYCTGGIRCEKASAYLKEQGFANVRQLHGGIHTYGEKTGGKHFQGKLYVFDGRVVMDVNTIDPSIISQCQFCGAETAAYRDCSEPSCGPQFICCDGCFKENGGY